MNLSASSRSEVISSVIMPSLNPAARSLVASAARPNAGTAAAIGTLAMDACRKLLRVTLARMNPSFKGQRRTGALTEFNAKERQRGAGFHLRLGVARPSDSERAYQVVSVCQTGFAVATEPRSVCYLDLRDYAPADACCRCNSVLREIPERVSRCAGAGGG